jgi:hypothetical protein
MFGAVKATFSSPAYHLAGLPGQCHGGKGSWLRPPSTLSASSSGSQAAFAVLQVGDLLVRLVLVVAKQLLDLRVPRLVGAGFEHLYDGVLNVEGGSELVLVAGTA